MTARPIYFSTNVINAEYIWVKLAVGAELVYNNVCCLYHPQKYLHQSTEIIDAIRSLIDDIVTHNSVAVIVLAGDHHHHLRLLISWHAQLIYSGEYTAQ